MLFFFVRIIENFGDRNFEVRYFDVEENSVGKLGVSVVYL